MNTFREQKLNKRNKNTAKQAKRITTAAPVCVLIVLEVLMAVVQNCRILYGHLCC